MILPADINRSPLATLHSVTFSRTRNGSAMSIPSISRSPEVTDSSLQQLVPWE